jgi:anti-sigma factor RsiW
MSTETDHAADWDSQRDLLSAFLDGRLEAEEETALCRHLEICSRCAEELAALRQVVGLLRALPAPALPRSFALPTGPGATSVSELAPAPLSVRTRRAAAWPRVAQWAGGLVAAAGLIIGIAGTVGHAPSIASLPAGSAAGVSSPRHSAPVPASATVGVADGPSVTGKSTYGGLLNGALPPGATAPVATPSAAGSLTAQPVDSQPLPEAPVIGVTLLIAGAASFAAGTRSRLKQR